MKKTLTVNLNGRVFNIDEDAYELLDKYLTSLRRYFTKEEGASEIIADFEARIEELFSERVRLGNEVITIEHVETIIERMGQPSDFGDEARPMDEATDRQKEQQRERRTAEPQSTVRGKKKFFRNIDDKMIGGVCSGLSAYFGWDALPVRIIFFILIFATSLWIVPIYLAVWVLVPGARTTEQKLQMRGEAITVENIGKTVAAEANPNQLQQRSGCWYSVLDFFVALLKVFAAGIGCLIGLPLLFIIVILMIVFVSVVFGVGGHLFALPFVGGLDNGSLMSLEHPVMASISMFLVLGIPLACIIYGIVSYFAKLKPLHVGVKWSIFGAWVIAFILLLTSGFKFNLENLSHTVQRIDSMDRRHSRTVLYGDGERTDRTEILPLFDNLVVDDDLLATTILVQTPGDSVRVLINGDSNLTDKVYWKQEGGRLELKMRDDYMFSNADDVMIRIETPNVKRVEVEGVGVVRLDGLFIENSLNLKMEGAGTFRADSLQVKDLRVGVEGVGKVNIGGTSGRAKYDLAGAGSIDALSLVADTVDATIAGVGKIRTNPVEYFSGSVAGVGSITYKSEPKVKKKVNMGIGKIGLD